jgi:hypothetical protein
VELLEKVGSTPFCRGLGITVEEKLIGKQGLNANRQVANRLGSKDAVGANLRKR